MSISTLSHNGNIEGSSDVSKFRKVMSMLWNGDLTYGEHKQHESVNVTGGLISDRASRYVIVAVLGAIALGTAADGYFNTEEHAAIAAATAVKLDPAHDQKQTQFESLDLDSLGGDTNN